MNADITKAKRGELGASLRIVIGPIEVQRFDLFEQSVGRDIFEGWTKELDVVAVRAVDRPADRDAACVRGDRPLPAEFCSVSGVGAVPSPPAGALCSEPSRETSDKSRPMTRS